jgi:hypothetical protein
MAQACSRVTDDESGYGILFLGDLQSGHDPILKMETAIDRIPRRAEGRRPPIRSADGSHERAHHGHGQGHPSLLSSRGPGKVPHHHRCSTDRDRGPQLLDEHDQPRPRPESV